MDTIYKYPLEIVGEQTIIVPSISKILSCQEQHGHPTLWILVDTEQEDIELTVFIYGTGQPLPNRVWGWIEFINSVQIDGLVWHVFTGNEKFL